MTIGTLDTIYEIVHQTCRMDDKGLYLDEEMVALDNSIPSGYIRHDGERNITKVGYAVFEVDYPLVFVGAYPNGNVSNIIEATVSQLVGGNITIKTATTDKAFIGEEENIDISKFSDVAMVRVTFDYVAVESYCRVTATGVDIFDLSFDPSFE